VIWLRRVAIGLAIFALVMSALALNWIDLAASSATLLIVLSLFDDR
jgi:hypothetical protein